VALTLTPEQQAALEAFDTASDKAREDLENVESMEAARVEVTKAAFKAQEEAILSQADALEAATTFVNLMLARPLQTPPLSSGPLEPGVRAEQPRTRGKPHGS